MQREGSGMVCRREMSRWLKGGKRYMRWACGEGWHGTVGGKMREMERDGKS
jgi:hypothetical protein